MPEGWTHEARKDWALKYIEKCTLADQVEVAIEVYSQLKKTGRPMPVEELMQGWDFDVVRPPLYVIVAFLAEACEESSAFMALPNGMYVLRRNERCVSSIPPRLRFAILQRDTYRCRLCGAGARDGDHVRLEVDHITPRSKGGTNDPSNLWTLCFDCNRGKGTKAL